MNALTTPVGAETLLSRKVALPLSHLNPKVHIRLPLSTSIEILVLPVLDARRAQTEIKLDNSISQKRWIRFKDRMQNQTAAPHAVEQSFASRFTLLKSIAEICDVRLIQGLDILTSTPSEQFDAVFNCCNNCRHFT